ncbi:MAG: hypothetical protein P1U86_15005 [Verrucomicrobiales bacterium]|nr:hypothetical protein [Verrucomicrobiales bacterium]
MNLQDHTYLFTITDRFAIEGRGVVVVPGIPWTEGTPNVRKGEPLILRTPLGDIIETNLQDIEMISYRPGAKRLEATPFSLPKEIHKFDIPVGTEVYLAASANEQTNSEQDVDPNA